MRPLLALLLLPLLATAASADVELRWDPANQVIATGTNGSLSVMLDDAIDVRTIELTVTYDPGILTSLAGSPGQLFEDSGCSLFPDFQDGTPGEWYGACVALGFDCWLTGPGELYRWDFEGTNAGISPIETIQVRLYAPDASIIADVTLPGTIVRVGEGTDTPVSPAEGLRLNLAPNPFNPSTRLSFSSATPGPARLDVFDTAGRLVATAWTGELIGDVREFHWQARDAAGRTLTSGVYLFRLRDAAGRELTRRGTLLK